MIRYIFCFLVLSFNNMGCSKTPEHSLEVTPTVKLSGSIDDKLLKRMKAWQARGLNSFIINSYGGNNKQGLDLLEHIVKTQPNITIDGVCLSACAEFILASNSPISLSNKPLIGFHRSPVIMNVLRKEYTGEINSQCDQGYAQRHLVLLKMAKRKDDYFDEILNRLDVLDYEIVGKNSKCPPGAVTFKHEFWFPTSKELDSIFGVRLSGNLCSDSLDCYSKKIPALIGRGKSYVVGDKIFYSPS